MSEKPLIDIDNEKILSLPTETQFAPNGSHFKLNDFPVGKELNLAALVPGTP